MGTKKTVATHARVVAGDLFHAIRTDRTMQIMVLLLVVSLLCWQMPFANILLYPFKLFVTTVHEACHAIATRLTGGSVAMIQISPDESGLTLTSGGFRPLIVMAGYIGTAIFGGFLIWWGKRPADARLMLQSIGTVILALTVFYGGGGIFSTLAMLFIGVGIMFVARKSSDMFCHMFLLMLAVQTTLNAVVDIQTLMLASVVGVNRSDAKTMESMTGIPAIFWALLWGAIAASILAFSLWFSYRPQAKSAKASSSLDFEPDSAFLPSSSTIDSPNLIGQDVESSLAELKMSLPKNDKEAQKIKIDQKDVKKKGSR